MYAMKPLAFVVVLVGLLMQSCARAAETASREHEQSVKAQGGEASSPEALSSRLEASPGISIMTAPPSPRHVERQPGPGASDPTMSAISDADRFTKEADELYEKGQYREAADAYRKIIRIYRVALDAMAPRPAAAVTADERVTIDIGNGVTFSFVLIRPGTFTMGSVDGESDEQPMHSVTITQPFYLGTVEVTQRQWAQVMDADPSRFKGADMPVDSVSWYDCQEFLKKLNSISLGHGFRLPTEAEWEYACRAGTTTRYWFGGDEMPMEPYAWVDTTSLNDPHPVGQLQPNPWGLCDMHGNVWEWCSDWHSHSYYMEDHSTDPQGPEQGDKKVLRGGSFSNPGPYSRSANRGYFDPDARRNNYGLRIAWTVE